MKIYGKIRCDLKREIGLICFERDLGLYIARLASRALEIDFAIPRLGCHATFLNGKFDRFDKKAFKEFKRKTFGKKVAIEVDFEKITCNLSKSGFYGVYVSIEERELAPFRKKCKAEVKPRNRFWAHTTFCTTKGIGIRRPDDFWVTITD